MTTSAPERRDSPRCPPQRYAPQSDRSWPSRSLPQPGRSRPPPREGTSPDPGTLSSSRRSRRKGPTSPTARPHQKKLAGSNENPGGDSPDFRSDQSRPASRAASTRSSADSAWLVFPNLKDGPAQSLQVGPSLLVPGLVLLDLLQPPHRIRRRPRGMNRTSVPETPVDVHSEAGPSKGDVDRPTAHARYRPAHPVSLAASVEQASKGHLRPCARSSLPTHPGRDARRASRRPW